MSNLIKQIEFPHHDSSESGKLVPIELESALPFKTKRIYYISAVPVGAVRGAHAHTIEEECFICIRGRCTATVSTDGVNMQKIALYQPHVGLYVSKLVWHEFSNFTPDAIMLCISSTPYLPDNYINNLDDFRKICEKKK